MTEDRRRPPNGDGLDRTIPTDTSLDDVREILFGQDMTRLEGELDGLEQRLTDRDTLIAIIAPVLGDAIRRQIRDAREEMIEALYPIVGQLVARAVSEAIRDLARSMDGQMRTTFSPEVIWRRFRARLSGVSDEDMALRSSLPFEVTEIFLIHRETGLLLRHVSLDPDASPDSDLISGMLTAIRDFTQEAFGRGQEGHLEEIQYGDRRILIEAARYAYLAVVVDGIEPPGFRTEMRERILEIDHTYAKTLRDYDGDPTPLAAVDESLHPLAQASEPSEMSATQKRVLAGAAGLVGVCLVGACLVGGWVWQGARSTPTPTALPIAVEPTSTSTATPPPTPTVTVTPSPSHTPTSTLTSTPMPTPTPTPTPAPVVGVMTGNAWLRQGPSSDSARLDVVMELGQPVEIAAVFGNWYQVRWAGQAQAATTGWVPARWVGTPDPVPAHIITPTPGS